jgi:DNA-directed RNA polymerase specialized sigma24 family protein
MSCRAESDRAFVAWILTIAKHVIVDELGSRWRRLAVRRTYTDMTGVAAAYALNAWLHDWDDAPQDAELTLARLADAAYERLPSNTASLVWSHVIHHASWAEVAVAFHTTPAAAKRRYQRAERTLRRMILADVMARPTNEREPVLEALGRRTHESSSAEGDWLRASITQRLLGGRPPQALCHHPKDVMAQMPERIMELTRHDHNTEGSQPSGSNGSVAGRDSQRLAICRHLRRAGHVVARRAQRA